LFLFDYLFYFLNHIIKIKKDASIQFKFPDPEPVSVQSAIQLIDVGFGYDGGRMLFSNVNLSINTDSRICLVGPNGIDFFFFFLIFWNKKLTFNNLGVGKSTLLKLIYEELKPTHGVVTINPKVFFFFF